MCAACGVPMHVAVLEPAEPPQTGQPARFAALRNPGVYGVGANGMRIGSGLTVGLFGVAVGLRPALGWSAAALCVCVAALAVFLAVAGRRGGAADAVPAPGAESTAG